MQFVMMKRVLFPCFLPALALRSFFRFLSGLALFLLASSLSLAAPPADPPRMLDIINSQPDFLIDFGSLEVGFVRTIGVGYSNVGGGPIANIELGELHGDDPQVFSIVQDNCTGLTLAPGQSCTLFFGFDPPAMADYSAELLVTSSAPASPELVRLIGTGIIDRIFSDRFQQLPPP